MTKATNRSLFRIAAGLVLFVVWGFAVLWGTILGASYLFSNSDADRELTWPLAGLALLFFFVTYTFAFNRLLIRLDR